MKLAMVRNVLILVFSFCWLLGYSADVPQPNRGDRALVKDLSDVLTESEEVSLCKKLIAYDDSTSNQIAVFVEERTHGMDAFERALEIGRSWGVGHGDKNNGVLIYVATTDRKTFVLVGTGLEHRITDAYAGRVVDYVLIPNFKSKGYYRGIDKAIDELILMAAGEYKASKKPAKGFPAWLIVVLIIIIIIIVSSFGQNNGKTYRGRRGGWVIGAGPGGYVGGGGGGGFSGGGFGGFGGGGFSGGGAGGSW